MTHTTQTQIHIRKLGPRDFASVRMPKRCSHFTDRVICGAPVTHGIRDFRYGMGFYFHCEPHARQRVREARVRERHIASVIAAERAS